MTNQEKLRRIIEEVVRKEIREIAPGIIKEVMTQVMGTMISEAVIDTTPSGGINNSNKRRSLQESSMVYDTEDQMEEYPTMGNRMMGQSDARAMGYGELRERRHSPQNLITVDHVMTEGGNPREIPVEAIPEAVMRAMNKDYRPLMAELERKKNGGF